ncbi:hypothetical protein Lalb_Chr09g0322581 [Lupinus albus]|uniref:Uncharacterized protein n=1 Tax=Lupinus albus TaxID=3870 RepID=A0A6A4PZD4_LUPAL|nr:hypothetical protein Lalb_Chr09g0322581 [Lupinus albus]
MEIVGGWTSLFDPCMHDINHQNLSYLSSSFVLHKLLSYPHRVTPVSFSP